MSQAIHIAKNERGVIRVFAINQSVTDVEMALEQQPKADLARTLLGSPHLDTTSTEIFPMSDLAGVGLGAYLTQGYAVDETKIAADRAKLDALSGYVLLLFSDSFGGSEAELDPQSALTMIGAYAEFQPASASTPIDTDSARPYSGAPGMKPPIAPSGGAGSAMVVLGLIVLVGLLLWWIFT